MTSIIVVGIHRSGTSLVSNVLRQLGVFMGDEFLEPDEGNLEGYWEDTEWLGINKKILGLCGGGWKNPPPPKDIVDKRDAVKGLVQTAVRQRRTRDIWGFKDPRTCLTAELLHPLLPDPHYIFVKRPRNEIIASLNKLHGKNDNTWGGLVKRYQQHIDAFIATIPPGIVTYVQYDDLVCANQAHSTIYWLAGWMGIKEVNLSGAMNVIKFRR